MFKVGQRIEITSDAGPGKGSIGIIRRIDVGSAGIEFPDWENGHNLGGLIKHGRGGWNVYLSDLKLMELDWDE